MRIKEEERKKKEKRKRREAKNRRREEKKKRKEKKKHTRSNRRNKIRGRGRRGEQGEVPLFLLLWLCLSLLSLHSVAFALLYRCE